MMLSRFLPPSLLLLCAALPGQQLLRDLNTAPSTPVSGSTRQLTGDGQRVFFTATTDAGELLFVSDGTTSGTRRYKDTTVSGYPGPAVPLGFVGGELLFLIGSELWCTAPTPQGATFLVDNLRTAWTQLLPLAVIGNVGNDFLFVERGSVGFTRLWRTDGTAAGTAAVTPLSIDRSFVHAGRAFVTGIDAAGSEPWVTDGTAAGTYRIADLVANGSSHPTGYAALGGVVHFLASEANGDTSLWRTDATAVGTVRIATFAGFQLQGANVDMVENNGQLLFAVGNALWRSDGTTAGTQQVLPGLSGIQSLRAIGGRVWFTASDAAGRELWSTDGTAAGTQRLVDLTPGAGSTGFSAFADVGGRLFVRTLSNNNWGMLATDGTVAGTSVTPTAASGLLGPAQVVPVAGGAVFNTLAGLDFTDGTAAGTTTLLPQGVHHQGSEATGGVALGDTLLFFADDSAGGRELWRTDGTASGTARVVDLALGPLDGIQPDAEIVVMDGYAYFTTGREVGASQPPRPSQLYRTDGTAAGTVALTSPAGGFVGYARRPQVHDHVLWFIDATPAGVRLCRTEGFGPVQVVPHVALRLDLDFLVADGLAYFYQSAYELWRSDGTAAGTYPLMNNVRRTLGVVGGRVLLDAIAGVYATDGTVAGTVLLRAAPPPNSSVTPVGTLDSDFYWIRYNSPGDYELLRTDGTPAGTAAVTTLDRPRQAVVANGAIHFIAYDAVHGYELWRSDGTAAGTARITDLAPGRENGVVDLAVCGAGNRLFLNANDGVTGLEPWVSDGTTGGTVQLVDANQVGSSRPTFLGVAAGRCYFVLDDGVHGREPWTAPVATLGAAVAQPLGRGCGGAAGVPELSTDGLPVLGNATFALRTAAVPAATLVGFVFAAQRAPTPLASGCIVWPAGGQGSAITAASLAGQAVLPLPLPAAPALLGAEITAQSAALDAFGTALPGVSSSNALILVAGG